MIVTDKQREEENKTNTFFMYVLQGYMMKNNKIMKQKAQFIMFV